MMKRRNICLTLLLAAWAVAMPLTAQVKFGLTGGAQIAQMEFDASALSRSNRVGFFVGPTVRLSTPLMGLGVDISAFYDQCDMKADTKTFTQQRLLIPANARLGASLFDGLGVFISAGPQLAFNVGDDLVQWTTADGTNHQFMVQGTTLSVNLGAGIVVGHLEGRVAYNIPIGRAADFTWDNISSQLQGESWEHAKSTVNAWRLSLTYYF